MTLKTWLQYVISYYEVIKRGEDLSLITYGDDDRTRHKNYLDYDESYKRYTRDKGVHLA